MKARSRFARLSGVDHMLFATEKPRVPQHIGGLCLIEAKPLLDAEGRLDIETIKRRLEQRLSRVPELRRYVRRAPLFGGRPIWADDPRFSIDHHVRAVRVAPPGKESDLLAAAERLLRPLLDRSHPLWELWFLTGLEDGRIGLLFKVHHAVADGLAAVALISSFFDADPGAPEPAASAWVPAPAPASWQLFADNVGGRLASLRSFLAHPLRRISTVASTVATAARMLPAINAAPRSSLNQRLREGRRLGVVHLDLEAAREVAHTHDGKVNDVVLDVVAGGVRELLAARGEPVEGQPLVAAVPVSLRASGTARELGNVVGVFSVPLPVAEPDAGRRLGLIAKATAVAKANQHLINRANQAGMALFGWLDTLGVHILDRQRMINFMVSNVVGPTHPFYVLGARVDEVMPFLPLFGNETLSFVALSYCGCLNLAFVADHAAVPDIDVLALGMQRSWQDLAVMLPAA